MLEPARCLLTFPYPWRSASAKRVQPYGPSQRTAETLARQILRGFGRANAGRPAHPGPWPGKQVRALRQSHPAGFCRVSSFGACRSFTPRPPFDALAVTSPACVTNSRVLVLSFSLGPAFVLCQ